MPSAFAATRDGIDALLRDRGLRGPARSRRRSRCSGAPTRVPCWPGRRPRSRRCGPAPATRSPASAVRMSTELLSLVPVVGRSPLQALARLHVLAGGNGPAGYARGGRAAAVAVDDPARAPSRAGPDGRRSRARRPGDGRSPSAPTTGSSRVPPSGWCSSRGESTRRRWSCPRPGTWRCARRTSPTCAATATVAAGAARLAALRGRGAGEGRRVEPAARAERLATDERHRTPQSLRDLDAARHTGSGYQACTF